MRNSLTVIIDLEETLFPEEVMNKMIEVVEGKLKPFLVQNK